jgi:two-component system, NtrC family, response regulator AtoC
MTAQKHILIIDDEENLRHMLSVMLSRQGYRADCAANGVEGLAALRGKVYDFILCDIRMPEMDGKAFLQAALRDQVRIAHHHDVRLWDGGYGGGVHEAGRL